MWVWGSVEVKALADIGIPLRMWTSKELVDVQSSGHRLPDDDASWPISTSGS